MYTHEKGKYGLHKDNSIMEIEMYSTTIEPQELHFHYRRSAQWAFVHDFTHFSDDKKELIRVRRKRT